MQEQAEQRRQAAFADRHAENALFGGRMNDARQAEVRTVMGDSIKALHRCLEAVPPEETVEDEPEALRIPLKPHQR